MTISYLDYFGKSISQQQASNLDEYYIVYSVNDKRKKSELIKNNELYRVYYYLDENESENEALSILKSHYELSFFVIIEIKIIGNYRYEIAKGFINEGELTSKNHALYNNLTNEFIAEEYIDLETNLPIYEETVKMFYNRSFDPENVIFEGFYNEDGSLDYIKFNYYESYPHLDCIWFGTDGLEGEEDIPTLCQHTGLNIEFVNYYLNASILPPPIL
jgi:hypothetical protein